MLVEHLARWRASRHVELADAIDRLTARGATPLDGKTVAERHARWIELADATIRAANDAASAAAPHIPEAVGRLLATPLPGTAAMIVAVVERLVLLPPDPRVAMALAAIVEAEALPRNKLRLRRHAMGRIFELRDARVVPRLRAHLSRGRGRVPEEQWLAQLARLAAPTLPAAELPAILAIGQPPDPEERALHATIEANPDDLAAHAVYADHLSRRGDPRGDFIALQLAAAPDEANLRRQHELVVRHGRAWAGALDRWFAGEPRVFERGMFAGGRLAPDLDGAEGRAPPLLGRGETGWRFVRTLEVRANTELEVAAFLVRPEASRVVRAGVFSLAAGARVAAGEVIPQLRELHFDARGATQLDDRLATCDALPALEVLGLRNVLDAPDWIAHAPVLDRVRRIALTQATAVAWAALAARRSPTLRELELHNTVDRVVQTEQWSAVLRRRGDTGPFDELAIDLVGREPGRLDVLASLLRAIPADWPRTIAIRGRVAAMAKSASERADFEQALRRFTRAERVDAPFELPTRVAAAAHLARARIPGLRALDAERFPIALRALAELDQHYDTFTVNTSRTQRPLGKDPVARVLDWIAKGLETTTLRNARGAEVAQLSDVDGGTFVLPIPPSRSLVEAAAWFARFVAAIGAQHGSFDTSPSRGLPIAIEGHVEAPAAAWVMVFEPRARALLATATPGELVALAPLATLDLVSTATHVAVRVGDDPADATPERLAVLAEALAALFEAGFTRLHGFAFRARVVEAFAPLVARFGLELRRTRAQAVGYHRTEGSNLGMIAELELADNVPQLTVTAMRWPRPASMPPSPVLCRARPVASDAELVAALADAVVRLGEYFAAT